MKDRSPRVWYIHTCFIEKVPFTRAVKVHISLKHLCMSWKINRHMTPDVAVCEMLLMNKDKGNWSDNPMKIANERELMEFKKKLEEEKMF